MRRPRASLFGVILIGACGPLNPSPPTVPLEAAPRGVPIAVVPPSFASVPTQAIPPPAISGGTLLVLRDGTTAVAADPDRDTIWIVDLATRALLRSVALHAGDEPGRVIEDGAGQVHVALRGGGAIVDLDPATGAATRRAACPEPRGLAWEPAEDRIHVACAGGELVSFATDGGPAVRTVHLADDLRDVVVDAVSGALWVTRFRTAEILELAPSGALLRRGALAGTVDSGRAFAPAVAWRTIAHPAGGVLIAHQRAQFALVQPRPSGAYYGADKDTSIPCSTAIVHGTVSRLARADGPRVGPTLPSAVLPVDLALNHAGDGYALVAAGNAFNAGAPQVILGPADAPPGCVDPGDPSSAPPAPAQGHVVAVAYDGQDRVIVQSREPPMLEILARPPVLIALPGPSRADLGHAIFHANSSGQIACASCHPEGGDDSRVWNLEQGPRRTIALAGGLLDTRPFHWNGDEPDFPSLFDEVFRRRMSGPTLAAPEVGALGAWVDRLPPRRRAPPADPSSVARGLTLFHDPAVGCATCHAGPRYTNNATVDVGTGRTFQVPRLSGLWAHAPYMHQGCASTLADRFGPCGGDAHGATDQLDDAQRADLIAFLETL